MPGSFFIGDTNGDGIIGPGDAIGLKAKVLNPSLTFPEVVPPTGDNLDLDGDGVIGPSDFIVIQNWILDNYTSFPARPQSLKPELHPYIITGLSNPDSVELSAQVFAANPNIPLSGWGVIFKVDTSGSYCTGVRLKGRRLFPIIGEGRDQYIEGDEVFEYTGPASQGAKAKVKLYIDNCAWKSIIRVTVRIPSDEEAKNPPGRHPTILNGNTAVNGEVHEGGVWMDLCGGGVCSGSGNGLLSNSYHPYMGVSADGLIHVVAGSQYRYWNGSAWSAVINIPFVGNVETMAINPVTYKPIVASRVGTANQGEIYLIGYNGTFWEEYAGSAQGGGVSNTPYESQFPSLAIAANGNPAIAWQEKANGSTYQIYFKRWNGSSWQELNGSASGQGVSNSVAGLDNPLPVLAVDNAGLPVIAWGDTHIYLKKWDGVNWIEIGGSASGLGIDNEERGAWDGGVSQARLIMAANDYPQVSYFVSGGLLCGLDGSIEMKKWTGSSWQIIYSEAPTGICGMFHNNAYFSSLDLAGNPLIAQDNLIYAQPIYLYQWQGTGWGGFDHSDTDGINVCKWGVGKYPSIGIYQGHYVIAWNEDGYQSVCGLSGVYLKVFDIP